MWVRLLAAQLYYSPANYPATTTDPVDRQRQLSCPPQLDKPCLRIAKSPGPTTNAISQRALLHDECDQSIARRHVVRTGLAAKQ
jgi:hypothetical protein